MAPTLHPNEHLVETDSHGSMLLNGVFANTLNSPAMAKAMPFLTGEIDEEEMKKILGKIIELLRTLHSEN
ncbi:hypothetical protein HOG48_02290 [Candidatus Peregrinibacteria bacterium]|jgi:hypothetical protein|nr:hypothetical protein [Candidatus Peregrinibacteria bacterium]